MKYKIKLGDAEIEFDQSEVEKVNEMIREYNRKHSMSRYLREIFGLDENKK